MNLSIVRTLALFMLIAFAINWGCNWKLSEGGMPSNTCNVPLNNFIGTGNNTLFQASQQTTQQVTLAAQAGAFLTTSLMVLSPYFIIVPIAITILSVVPAPQVLFQELALPDPFAATIYTLIMVAFTFSIISFITGRQT